MRASDSIIPASCKFLSGHGTVGLRRRHGKEKDSVIALRLTYAKRKQGMTIRRICDDIGRPCATVRNWLVRAAGAASPGGTTRPGPGCGAGWTRAGLRGSGRI